MPVFNAEKYLEEALESIKKQTYKTIEVIVVDDGSTDRSISLVRQFVWARIVSQPHSGLSAALNTGIREAKGDYFAFLDADDIWMEHKLELQMRAFENNPGLEAVFGNIVPFHGSIEKNGSDGISFEGKNKKKGLCKGTMLIKKEAFFRVGLFDPQLRVGDFIDWYQRAMRKNLKSLIIPQVVMKRRIHGGNMSFRNEDDRIDYVRIVKAVMDRRRLRETPKNQNEGKKDINGRKGTT